VLGLGLGLGVGTQVLVNNTAYLLTYLLTYPVKTLPTSTLW